MTVSTRLLDRLTSSGLLGQAEARRLRARAGTASAEALAQELVAGGVLTPFQADVLLHDDAHPLALGEYVLLDRIGQGGMGLVFKARHRRMERLVALKVLSPELTGTPEAEERFYREVRAIARLSHPNIVLAHDASEAEGVHYLVMELVEGKDLDAVVRDEGPLAVGEALRVTSEAAEALACAHEAGIVHRDVKPSNLLRTRDGRIKLLDLGIARLGSADGEGAAVTLTRTNFLLGSIAYMAPEHAEDPRRADQRSDVYSLGCTLYQMLTGRLPFTGSSAVQVLLAARERPAPDVRESLHALPGHERELEALQALFARMVAKDPAQRPATMRAVAAEADALRQALSPAVAALHAAAPPREAGSGHGSGPGAHATPRAARWPSAPGRPRPLDPATGSAATLTTERPSSRSAPGTDSSGATRVKSAPGATVARGVAPVAQAPRGPAGSSTTAPPEPKRSGRAPSAAAPAGSGSLATWAAGGALAALLAVGAWLGLRPDPGPAPADAAATAATSPAPSTPPATTEPPAGAAATPPAAPEVSAAPGMPLQAPPRPADSQLAPAADLLALAARERQDGWRRTSAGSRTAYATTTDGVATLVVPYTPEPAYLVTLDVEPQAPSGAAGTGRVAGAGALVADVRAPLRLHLSVADGDVRVVEVDRATADGRVASRITKPQHLDRDPAPPAPDAGGGVHGAVMEGRLLEPGRTHRLEVELHPAGTIVRLDGRAVMMAGQVGPGDGPPGAPVAGQVGLVTAVPTVVSRFEAAALLPPDGSRRVAASRGGFSVVGGDSGSSDATYGFVPPPAGAAPSSASASQSASSPASASPGAGHEGGAPPQGMPPPPPGGGGTRPPPPPRDGGPGGGGRPPR